MGAAAHHGVHLLAGRQSGPDPEPHRGERGAERHLPVLKKATSLCRSFAWEASVSDVAFISSAAAAFGSAYRGSASGQVETR